MLRYLQRAKDKYREVRSDLRDIQALTKLTRLQLGYVPWSASFALKPFVMSTLINDVIINGRRNVVEFGAGISTIHLAKLFEQHGETESVIISIEDDAAWAEVVRSSLAREGLQDLVRIIVAPLKPCSISVGNIEWYDEEAVAEAIAGIQIDLAVVDGPKAWEKGRELARFPAFRAVAASLAPRSAIFLDDISRQGEQRVLELWQNEPLFDFSIMKADRCAICYRGAYFDPR